jgi:hypothetical protein
VILYPGCNATVDSGIVLSLFGQARDIVCYGLFFTIIIAEIIPQSNLVFPRMLNGGLCMYPMATSCALTFIFTRVLIFAPLISVIVADCYVCEPHCQLYFEGYQPHECREETRSLCVFKDSSLFKPTLISSLHKVLRGICVCLVCCARIALFLLRIFFMDLSIFGVISWTNVVFPKEIMSSMFFQRLNTLSLSLCNKILKNPTWFY